MVVHATTFYRGGRKLLKDTSAWGDRTGGGRKKIALEGMVPINGVKGTAKKKRRGRG